MSHNFIKHPDKSIECTVCKWIWASKTNTVCPGVERFDYKSQPPHLKNLVELHKQNLKPKKGAKPSGCCYSRNRNEWTWFYDVADCEINDPQLPPIVQWDEVGELKTVGQLKKINLAPSEDTKPRAVAWVWDRDEEWGKWIPLYHEDDCKWNPRDNYISKYQLQIKYLLSRGWIKKLGKPDKEVVNTQFPNGSTIKLYSRQRIEKFLADNAIEYAEWLDKRDKHIAIFEANKHKIFARRNLIKEQTKLCLQCASGCTLGNGFFCAIHPAGLDELPCGDFKQRDE